MSIAIDARRPGLKSWVLLVLCEAKMVARDTVGLIVPIGLPLLILVMNASSASDEIVMNGRTALDLIVLPIVLTTVIAAIGIFSMPTFLAYYRRSGILRRLSVTPASPAMVLVSQVVVSIMLAFIGLAVALTVAMLGFGANLPVHLGAACGVLILAMVAMYAVGMIVASIAPTQNSALAIGLVLFFALSALGGLFGGPDALPEPLAAAGAWLPFGAAVEALAAAWAGTAIEAGHLISLGATSLIGVIVAAALFRWE